MDPSVKPNAASLTAIIDLYPVCIYTKNLNGVYQDVNATGIELMHNKQFIDKIDKREMVGKNDFDLFNHDVATLFHHNDQMVLTDEREFCFQEYNITSTGERILHTTTKKPLYDVNQNLIGIVCATLTKMESPLKSNDIQVGMLSKREQQCLHYFWQGLTSKETAKKLHLSHRTIEQYFESIKSKLHCNNKRELHRFA